MVYVGSIPTPGSHYINQHRVLPTHNRKAHTMTDTTMTHFLCRECSSKINPVMVGVGEWDLHMEWHELVNAVDDGNEWNATAFAALVEWVIANDLADTDYDPRLG